jgi:RimJ/RimL family protein N-acetyltransferase
MEVRGGQVVLRQWRMEDFRAVTAACQDAEIARWLALVPQPYNEEDARFYIEQGLASPDERRPFAITDASTAELAGAIDMRASHLKTGHVYWVAPQARGRGVAPDALVTLSRWAFESLGLGRMELLTHPQNVASQRVAEKAGFQREGVLRGALPEREGGRRDGVMFSLLPSDLD